MRKMSCSIIFFFIISIRLVIGSTAYAGIKQAKDLDLHIAIVGAGASGLTAAYNLKKSGYKKWH
ncbi:MAG: NAD(P)-binding protein [bacterium]